MPRPKLPIAQTTPQRKLDQRMLGQAMRDLRPGGRREQEDDRFESAARWVWGADDAKWGMSFGRVCERLGRQVDAVRDGVWTTLPLGARERVSGVLEGEA